MPDKEQQETTEEQVSEPTQTEQVAEAMKSLFPETASQPEPETQKTEPPPVEEAKEPEKKVESSEDVLANHYREIERREVAARKALRDAKELAEKYQKYAQVEESTGDPRKVLETLGLSADDIIESEIDAVVEQTSAKNPQIEKLSRAYNSIEEKYKQLQQELHQERFDRQKLEHTRGLEQYIKRNSEKYPLLAEYLNPDVVEAMFNFQADWNREYAEVPSVEQVAERFDSYYKEELKAHLERAKKLKGFEDYFNKVEAEREAQKQIPTQKQEPSTLTNKHAAEPGTVKPISEMTREEIDRYIVENGLVQKELEERLKD